jgi:hypothetical protein
VHHFDGPGAVGNGRLDLVDRDIAGGRVGIHEYGRGTGGHDGRSTRRKCKARQNHFVSRPHADESNRHLEGVCARRGEQCVRRARHFF